MLSAPPSGRCQAQVKAHFRNDLFMGRYSDVRARKSGPPCCPSQEQEQGSGAPPCEVPRRPRESDLSLQPHDHHRRVRATNRRATRLQGHNTGGVSPTGKTPRGRPQGQRPGCQRKRLDRVLKRISGPTPGFSELCRTWDLDATRRECSGLPASQPSAAQLPNSPSTRVNRCWPQNNCRLASNGTIFTGQKPREAA